MKYDTVIIGAGMSGLAAGIRLAHFGKKVCICEQHYREGGLNSYFDRHNFRLETGLHAMTNFVHKGASNAMPLLKLLRQLRIPYDALKLREQRTSEIVFPDHRLEFSNDFAVFRAAVDREFPSEIDAFDRFNQAISEYDINQVVDTGRTAREVMKTYFHAPELCEMLLTPVMFYGSPSEEDMEWYSFVVMYRSIFHEGFCRPAETGIRHLLTLLKERFLEAGGALLLNSKVKRIVCRGGRAIGVEAGETGQLIEANNILSSAGSVETGQLCSDPPPAEQLPPAGTLAYFEAMIIPHPEFDFHSERTVIFFNRQRKLAYRDPQDLCDFNSCLICFPHHFQFLPEDRKPEPMLRISVLANHQFWHQQVKERYDVAKEQVFTRLLALAEEVTGAVGLKENMLFCDAFSPRTVSRFTGHINGAIYGSPIKLRNGRTHLPNLFICGTDQGFLGITGAMMSGITIANRYLMV